MRDQYAADLSDYLKFALLRTLSGAERKLGIAWYYIPENDRRNDGQHLEWQQDITWRLLDPELFDALRNLPERSIKALENAKIWPHGTLFHREPIPSRRLRDAWITQMYAQLENSELVFFDPDNGLGTHPKKHATFSELRGLRASTRAIVSIKFPAMSNYERQADEFHNRLRHETGTTCGFTVFTNVSVPRKSDPRYVVQRPRWFTVIDADATLLDRANRYALLLSSLPQAKARIVSF